MDSESLRRFTCEHVFVQGNFEKKPELQKVQRESKDASLGVIRAAVSRSYTVVAKLH